MADTYFLPDWPLAGNLMFWVGLLLIAGLLGGEAAQRYLKLPRITGYAAAGMVMGVGGLGVIDEPVLQELSVIVDISIGLILFELGQRLDLRERRDELRAEPFGHILWKRDEQPSSEVLRREPPS